MANSRTDLPYCQAEHVSSIYVTAFQINNNLRRVCGTKKAAMFVSISDVQQRFLWLDSCWANRALIGGETERRPRRRRSRKWHVTEEDVELKWS